ncbi:MAG: orotidine-5'-phosphate decarboxylase [Candidatus Portnoybacteria bacterium CG23_combo_of_CG06-09_8_20_14_all_37_13]|uniref:Orotidine-5'-phosphate decarboxylase n=1 Tax=Candidatus Portnoybacteria bacterium CG23_combo_of_CG06-09_8_20_14_all_37_13 TaxID=1974819 RepID=A0A2G9YC40_9BACT|nr:MAG: orotidine-5'-phosphate decarboxylase [Candidatus Portnoybacteria bacterium CG23_combo_of_CG06-09_8_20_14_all_37_13]
MKKGFRQKLAERQEKANSLVCVGLDPLEEKIPECVEGRQMWSRILVQMREIIDATAEYASMFKPQKAHYEAIPDGQKALQGIVDYIHTNYPDIPVLLDCKRGDIDRTQQRYRIAHFKIDGVDGMNFNPYMGKDCMEQLVDKNHLDRAIVGLCYTSNSSARETQDVKLADGRYYWEFIAETTLRWAEELGIVENAGLVMAAAYESPKGSDNIFSKHLSRCREIVGNKLWLLIPGIGTQGGFIAETIKASYLGPGTIAINSSSAITFASLGEDFAEAAGKAAKKLRDQINEAKASII